MGIEKVCSVASISMRKGYQFLEKVYERDIFSVKNGKGLELGAEVKLC